MRMVLFEFDITFENYPNRAPRVTFVTTGNNQVCFGPRLFKTGLVQLQILNTYGRTLEELWTPQTTISEILFALQGLVKTNNLCEGEMELASLRADENTRKTCK